MQEPDFPTPICHIVVEHPKHIIPGTWRTQCPGKTNTTENSRHFTASMVILNQDADRVLLVHHNLTGIWQFPGGHVEENEEPGVCAIREAMEETGVEVTQAGTRFVVPGAVRSYFSPLAVAEFVAPADPEWNEPEHRHIDMLYMGLANDQTALIPQVGEVHGAQWFYIRNLSDKRVAHAEIRADVYPMARRAQALLMGTVTA